MPALNLPDATPVSITVNNKTTVRITNDIASASNVGVHVHGLNDEDGSNDDLLAPGETGYYRHLAGDVNKIDLTAGSASGANVRWGAVSLIS